MNDNAFPEFNVNSNLAVRRPTRAHDSDCMFSGNWFPFPRCYLWGLVTPECRAVLKAFRQPASQMLKWSRTPSLLLRPSEKAVVERPEEGLALRKDAKQQVWWEH